MEIPKYIEGYFKQKDVWDKFLKLAISHKKEYIQWIDSAKKEETKFKRLEKSVEMIKEK
jgi:uncharacterized protein YdeI (YjbR/CyaY-like superfamily)